MAYERMNLQDNVDKWTAANIKHLEDAIVDIEEVLESGGITPEQIAGIAQSAAEILTPEIDRLKIDKLDKTPTTWPEWTSEEQAAACKRVSAIRSYGDGWNLKAKWIRNDPITVDFSGCSEFFIAGYIKTTGAVNLYTNLIVNQICFRFSNNDERNVRMLYCNQPTGGIAPIYAKYSSSNEVQADNLTAYCIGKIGATIKVSDITTFYFNNTEFITSLDIDIYAR